jgi:chromosome segregation ATPase
MSSDLRGFQYAAEPVLRRRQWELDAVVAEMGRMLARIAQARSHAMTLHEQLVAQSAASTGAVAARLDPGAHARSLAWLAQLQGRIADAERVLRQLDDQREEVTLRLRASQANVEAIEAHREDAVRDFAADAASRQASEADRDWLARRAADTLSKAQS